MKTAKDFPRLNRWLRKVGARFRWRVEVEPNTLASSATSIEVWLVGDAESTKALLISMTDAGWNIFVGTSAGGGEAAAIADAEKRLGIAS